jgi:hypothetical protein
MYFLHCVFDESSLVLALMCWKHAIERDFNEKCGIVFPYQKEQLHEFL